MLRLGMLDVDTSHSIEFARRLNRRGIQRNHHVHGAEVVVACAGQSRMSPERIPGFVRDMEQIGIRFVQEPTDMIGQVDGMLIESLEGAVHLERARPFLEAGLPCFIDKPFSCSRADALAIIALAKKYDAPVFSASSLRYAPEVVAFRENPEHGKLLGALTYGPAPSFLSVDGEDHNPGLFHYGIHAVEMLYTLMGPGCVRVSCHQEAEADIVVGNWEDGRLGTMRGIRSGATAYGFLAFTESGIHHVCVKTTWIYRELCKQIVHFFKTEQAPVDPEVTVEIMTFLERALFSSRQHGDSVSIM